MTISSAGNYRPSNIRQPNSIIPYAANAGASQGSALGAFSDTLSGFIENKDEEIRQRQAEERARRTKVFETNLEIIKEQKKQAAIEAKEKGLIHYKLETGYSRNYIKDPVGKEGTKTRGRGRSQGISSESSSGLSGISTNKGGKLKEPDFAGSTERVLSSKITKDKLQRYETWSENMMEQLSDEERSMIGGDVTSWAYVAADKGVRYANRYIKQRLSPDEPEKVGEEPEKADKEPAGLKDEEEKPKKTESGRSPSRSPLLEKMGRSAPKPKKNESAASYGKRLFEYSNTSLPALEDAVAKVEETAKDMKGEEKNQYLRSNLRSLKETIESLPDDMEEAMYQANAILGN